MTRDGPWIMTASGRQVYPFDIRPDDIHIEDVAAHLSKLCRFTGATRVTYSVAEHSVRVSYACDTADALWGLLHDASEAYIGDMAGPLKRFPSDYATCYLTAERDIMEAVRERFRLHPWGMPESVRRADGVLLATERRDLMMPSEHEWWLTERPLEERIEPWDWRVAENLFLQRYEEVRHASL